MKALAVQLLGHLGQCMSPFAEFFDPVYDPRVLGHLLVALHGTGHFVAAGVAACPADSPVRPRRTAAVPARPRSRLVPLAVASSGAAARVLAGHRPRPPSSTPAPPAPAPPGPGWPPSRRGHDRPSPGIRARRIPPS